MSEDQLYEIARQRVDKRNRRRTWWALDLGGLILSLALVALLGSELAAAFFLAWGGVFTIHTILLVMANSHEKDIESEVARLRSAVDMDDEKPKRLALTDDGELTDIGELDERPDKRRSNSL